MHMILQVISQAFNCHKMSQEGFRFSLDLGCKLLLE